MALEIVNGVPCFNCTDVENAKKNSPKDPSTLFVAAAADNGRAPGPQPFQTPNDPLALGDRGRIYNFGA